MLENLNNLRATLTLYSNTSLTDAGAVTVSDAQSFLDSKSFTDWRKGEEARLKLQSAHIDATNNVVRAINVLIKSK